MAIGDSFYLQHEYSKLQHFLYLRNDIGPYPLARVEITPKVFVLWHNCICIDKEDQLFSLLICSFD